MNKERIIFLILIFVVVFSSLEYASSLRKQNKILSDSIEQIMKRIAALESESTIDKIVALKAENAGLKREIKDLRSELKQGSKGSYLESGKEMKKGIETEKPTEGNQGFLLKDGVMRGK